MSQKPRDWQQILYTALVLYMATKLCIKLTGCWYRTQMMTLFDKFLEYWNLSLILWKNSKNILQNKCKTRIIIINIKTHCILFGNEHLTKIYFPSWDDNRNKEFSTLLTGRKVEHYYFKVNWMCQTV